MEQKDRRDKLLAYGVVIAILYGLLTRLVFRNYIDSIAFMYVLPTVLGIIPLFFGDDETLKLYRVTIGVPLITSFLCLVAMLITRLEDIICILIISLPFLMLSITAGLLFMGIRHYLKNRKGPFIIVLILPFVTLPVEESIESPSAVYTVKSEVIIDAPAAYIWKNIVRVNQINPSEYTPGTFNYLGIPRPIQAELDTAQTGGKRTGHFEGGLVFNETVTVCEPNKKISFDILVDPKTVRNKVFDQHVLNGSYFSFVNATYQLEEINKNQVKLSLTSGYRLTSKINFYSKFWGNIILEDFQDRLLAVIKKRCDGQF